MKYSVYKAQPARFLPRTALRTIATFYALFAASNLGAQTVPTDSATRVFGVVFDSLARRPLSGATVQLVVAADPSRVRTATANQNGEYFFNGVPIGSYILGFFHPRLDSLGINAPLLRVDVRSPGELRAPLGIPSTVSVIGSICGPNSAADSTGLFQGRVRKASGEPLTEPGRVRVRWTEIFLGPRGIERSSPSTLATTSDDGAFAICGVPIGGGITVRAWSGTDSSGYVEFDVPAAGYLHRDIFVSRATLVSPPESVREFKVARGSGSLTGTVRSLTGQPVQGARVGVWSSGLEVATGPTGQFSINQLPMGTYTLETRAVGFQIERRPVDITVAREGSADVTLEPLPTLDTVRVRAERLRRAPLAEFDSRKNSGFGYFMDENAIEKRQALTTSDLFRLAPGVVVSPGRAFGDQILLRGNGAQSYCIPTLFLNGNRTATDDGNIDQLVSPRDVRAVEVYSRNANTPAQFQALGGCGAIVIWTKGR